MPILTVSGIERLCIAEESNQLPRVAPAPSRQGTNVLYSLPGLPGTPHPTTQNGGHLNNHISDRLHNLCDALEHIGEPPVKAPKNFIV